MSSPDDLVEVEVCFEESLLADVDRLRQQPGYESRSAVVTAAIEASTDGV